MYDKSSGPHNRAESIGKCPCVLRCMEIIRRTANCPVDIMAFERMDTILSLIPPEDHRSTSNLPRLIARWILQALVVLDQQGVVHNAISEKNIFLSGVDSREPEIRLGNFVCCKWPARVNAFRNM